MSDGSVWVSQVVHLGWRLGGRAQVRLSSRDGAELGAWYPSKEARAGHRPLLSSLGSQVPAQFLGLNSGIQGAEHPQMESSRC